MPESAASGGSRRRAARLVSLLGAALAASGLLLNPWVARALGPYQRVMDRLDVLSGYLVASLLLGGVTYLVARAIGRRLLPDGLSLAVLVVVVLVVVDRLLLVWFGLPLWVPDPVLHYRNRPNATRTLAYAQRPRELIHINRFGHHDDDFPAGKPAGELRGVLLGDSVSMAFGLTYRETFAAELERRLTARDPARSYQIIDTAVMGYATEQEAETLEDALRFSPDIILIGFCLNDFTDPFVQDRQRGGTGLDGNRVAQTSSRTAGWLVNETGYGRLALALKAGRNRQRLDALSRALEPASFLTRQHDAQLDAAWRIVLSHLEHIYALANERRVPVFLLLFPAEVQLVDVNLTPVYARLAAHARSLGAEPIDFTPVLAAAVFDDPALLAFLRERRYSDDDILEIHRPRIRRYFLDELHLTERSHRIIAATLAERLIARGLVGGPPASKDGVEEGTSAAPAERDQQAKEQGEHQDRP